MINLVFILTALTVVLISFLIETGTQPVWPPRVWPRQFTLDVNTYEAGIWYDM